VSQIIAQGSSQSLGGLGAYETHFQEGESGVLRIRMRYIPPGLMAALNVRLRVNGVQIGPAYTESGHVIAIPFTKQWAVLALIAVAVVALAALAIGWALEKLGGAAEKATWPIIAIVAGIAVVALAGASRAKRQHA